MPTLTRLLPPHFFHRDVFASSTGGFTVTTAGYYLVEGISGGGGGGDQNSGWVAGGGGGGGGYASGSLYLDAGAQLVVTIGQGGVASAGGDVDGNPGTATVVATKSGVELVRASGGLGGGGAGRILNTAGGAGGAGSANASALLLPVRLPALTLY